MQNDWIIDVLADLNRFARSNDMSALAAQLEETAVVASVELASKVGDPLFENAGTQAGDQFQATGPR